jgi:hypothetical protein
MISKKNTAKSLVVIMMNKISYPMAIHIRNSGLLHKVIILKTNNYYLKKINNGKIRMNVRTDSIS